MHIYKTLITIILTAALAGGGVFLWQNKQLEEPVKTDPKVAESVNQELENELTLSPEYLTQTDWGPEASTLGAYIEFETDGSFVSSFAGEGDGPHPGTYSIENNKLILSYENGNESIYTLGSSTHSLYFTEYLAQNGVIRYWNLNSGVKPGEERFLNNFILLTLDSDLKPTESAIPKKAPQENEYYNYAFKECLEETCYEESLESTFRSVIARTQYKKEINGVEDYWYLANVQLGWYSSAYYNNGKESEGTNQAWIHGSELE